MSTDLKTYEVQQGGITVGNATRDEGDLVTLDPESEEAKIKSENGLIKETDKDTAAETDDETSQETSEDEEEPELKAYANSSNWLSADDVEKGDIITILSEHEMQTYEDDKSPVIKVEHKQSQAKLRLNQNNTENIAEEFGWDSENWIGKQIKVVSIQHYPGVDAEGMILEPHTNS